MTDNDIVAMRCSECGHVVHERPEVFFGNFECPQCGYPAIFRWVREEALPAGRVRSTTAVMRTAIKPKILAGAAAAGIVLGLGVWFCGWRHAQDAKIDALSASREIDAALINVLGNAVEAERAHYADREQTVSEKVASAQDLQKAAMQMREIMKQEEKALQARETAAESVLRREKQVEQLEDNLARREEVLTALQKELAALKSETALREKAVAAHEVKNARSEEHIMKMLANISEKSGKKDPPQIVIVQPPAPRRPASIMRIYTTKYINWNPWWIHHKRIPVYKRPVEHKTPAVRKPNHSYKTLSEISLVVK